MDREHQQMIKDALEFARHVSRNRNGECVINFAAYIIRRDGIMSKEKSERLVREYMKRED